MNNIKIADAFANGKAFIPFITCGDPNLETTKEVVHAAVEAGANLIELGIPFSDPITVATTRRMISSTITHLYLISSSLSCRCSIHS